MSMLALPESECQEILELFREKLPRVPDAWLQELAANYGLCAIVDIDPNDVIAILSVSGKLHRVQVPLAQHEVPEKVHRRIRDELIVRNIRADRITSSLLMIRYSSEATLADIGNLVWLTTADCMGNASKGWAWYTPKPLVASTALTWIFRSLD